MDRGPPWGGGELEWFGMWQWCGGHAAIPREHGCYNQRPTD